MTEKTNYQHFKKVQLATEKKTGFTYASWSCVWEKVIEYDDKATFEVHETEKGFPAFINSTGGMVKVSVTIKEITRTQWLHIMGYGNKSLTKEQITSTEINKHIQRCLVKCIALFGLGLYIYKGEDLPEKEDKLDEQLEEELETIANHKGDQGDQGA